MDIGRLANIVRSEEYASGYQQRPANVRTTPIRQQPSRKSATRTKPVPKKKSEDAIGVARPSVVPYSKAHAPYISDQADSPTRKSSKVCDDVSVMKAKYPYLSENYVSPERKSRIGLNRTPSPTGSAERAGQVAAKAGDTADDASRARSGADGKQAKKSEKDKQKSKDSRSSSKHKTTSDDVDKKSKKDDAAKKRANDKTDELDDTQEFILHTKDSEIDTRNAAQPELPPRILDKHTQRKQSLEFDYNTRFPDVFSAKPLREDTRRPYEDPAKHRIFKNFFKSQAKKEKERRSKEASDRHARDRQPSDDRYAKMRSQNRGKSLKIIRTAPQKADDESTNEIRLPAETVAPAKHDAKQQLPKKPSGVHDDKHRAASTQPDVKKRSPSVERHVSIKTEPKVRSRDDSDRRRRPAPGGAVRAPVHDFRAFGMDETANALASRSSAYAAAGAKTGKTYSGHYGHERRSDDQQSFSGLSNGTFAAIPSGMEAIDQPNSRARGRADTQQQQYGAGGGQREPRSRSLDVHERSRFGRASPRNHMRQRVAAVSFDPMLKECDDMSLNSEYCGLFSYSADDIVPEMAYNDDARTRRMPVSSHPKPAAVPIDGVHELSGPFNGEYPLSADEIVDETMPTNDVIAGLTMSGYTSDDIITMSPPPQSRRRGRSPKQFVNRKSVASIRSTSDEYVLADDDVDFAEQFGSNDRRGNTYS